ncbi:MAG: Cu(I)-responsive transcriptional regulator [Rhodospirillales bacterium]|nr:Cu(I)-responsive transcriptional regulator [Rhodospirillales bacterium]
MNIGTVAEKSGVPAKTIRYYEEIGLIPPAFRTDNGYRNYGQTDVETLRFIQRARKLGFTVKDVSNLVALWQDTNRASADVKELALRHIEEVERRIAELESIRDTLVHLTDCCHGDDRPDCPILNGLAQS